MGADGFGGHDLAIAYRPVGDLLADYAARHPRKAAIVDLDQDVTIDYGDLLAAVTDIAVHLKQRGIGHGSRVVVLADEVLEKLLIWLALWRIGAVVAPLNIELNARHIVDLTRMCRPALVLAHDKLELPDEDFGAPLVRFGRWDDVAGADFFAGVARNTSAATLRESNAPQDLSCLFCTSGTTGTPKIVAYDHAAYWLNGLDTIDMLELTGQDRTLEYRSFGWNSAQILSLMPMLQTGLTLHMARRFSQSRFFDWIRNHQISFAVGVPTVINILLTNEQGIRAQDVPSLTRMTCSTAPLSAEQWQRFEAMYGLNLLQLYGMSEAGWICGNTMRDRRVGTVGRPAIHQEFRVVDAAGVQCPPGVEGEVTIGGPQVAVGYQEADGTISPIRGNRIKTGDLAVVDDEGFVRVTGRTKDLIIRGGVNIAPVEIDAVLLAIEGVQEAAAVGVPDPIYGEEVVAYVVAVQGNPLNAEMVMAACREQLPAAKVPKQVFFVDKLVRNDRGKVIRDELRSDWLGRKAASA